MKVALSENVITGLKEIQNNEETLIDYFRSVEDFIIDCDIKQDSDLTLTTVRLVRLLRTYITPLFDQSKEI